ncbi:MAG TPA: hypothetical protein PKG55_01335 [Acidobacteriota bacterium]|jgi:hypothetical protein|nr:hypothetical protein [Acidobacteriota bacterium]
MKRILIALLVMLYALTGRGEVGSTKLSVEIKNTSAVLGEPVIIEVKMESTGVFKLAREFGPCDGGLLRIAVKNASGINTLIATDLPPCPSVLPPPSDVPVVYPSYQGQAKFTYKYWLMPGDYEVQASYHSENNTQNETAPFWTGILSSNVVMCHVDYPKGDDLQALLALGIDPSKEASPKIYVSVIRDHSIELLKKFPTSTYAAYAMFGNPGSPRVAMTPEEYLEKVHKPKFLNGAFKTDDNRNILKNEKGENIWLTAEDIQRGIIEKGDLILKHHPDFVYRDELRFRMAQAYIALYEEKKAIKLFEEIACDAVNEADRQKAKRYMELLVSPEHKGRLSTEEQSEQKKQEMKEPPKK